MLHVTSQARVALRDRLLDVLEQQARNDAGLSFRLIAQQDRIGLALDSPTERDQVVEHEGRSVLLVEPEMADALSERTLNAVETTEGTRLQLEEKPT